MKVINKNHAGFVAELLAAERKRTFAEIADWIANMSPEEFSKMRPLDLYQLIIDTFKCEDFLEEVEI